MSKTQAIRDDYERTCDCAHLCIEHADTWTYGYCERCETCMGCNCELCNPRVES